MLIIMFLKKVAHFCPTFCPNASEIKYENICSSINFDTNKQDF